VIEGIQTLNEHSKYALYALLTLNAEDDTPARTRRIHERYELICDMGGYDSLTSRRVRDFLQELSMLGAVEMSEQNQGKGGGQYYEFDIAHPIQMLIRALDDVIESHGRHSSLDEHHG
jgi:cell division control protein 6